MAEELYQKQRERARSRSIRRQKSIADSKKREMTQLEKHNLLTSTVMKLGHDMTVFHLRWVPGDYLDEDILNSVPMFWFKKFGWRPEDIKVLYAVGQIKLSAHLLTEMQKVYGKKKKGKKNKTKKHILLQNQDSNSPQTNDEETVFMRTKRLKKQNVSSKNVFNSLSRKNSTSISRSASKSDVNATHEIGYPINLKNQGSVGMTHGIIDPNDSDRERADTGLNLPRATHSFSSHHRRQSSMSSRRPSLVESGELIWSRLAANRGDTLNRRQFDIELQNNHILADPDVSGSMFDILRNNQKDRKTITKEDFMRVYPQLDSIPLKDEIEDPRSLDETEKMMIVLKQVLYHVMSQNPFDVNDYLTPKLRAKDLSDPQKIIKEIGSRDSDWRIRLQIMEWITANMEDEMSGNNVIEQLTISQNLGPFLLGWMTQCLDERSNLSKAALYMFPEVYEVTLTHNLEAFGYLNDIMKSLFLVLKNKRSEQLSQVADHTAIELIEMIMEWHQNSQLDNEILLELCEIFRDNTSMKEQKHAKVRERCCAYFGYILYGLDTSTLNNNNGKTMIVNAQTPTDLNVISEIPESKSKVNVSDSKDNTTDNKEDEKENANKSPTAADYDKKVTIKISKTMRRAYLLEPEAQFSPYMAAALERCTADKEESVRTVAFRFMTKIEKSDEKILAEMFKDDPYTIKRFEKFKSRKALKKGKSSRRQTVSAVKQAREKAMLKRAKSTNQKQNGAAKTTPIDATVETTMD